MGINDDAVRAELGVYSKEEKKCVFPLHACYAIMSKMLMTQIILFTISRPGVGKLLDWWATMGSKVWLNGWRRSRCFGDPPKCLLKANKAFQQKICL